MSSANCRIFLEHKAAKFSIFVPLASYCSFYIYSSNFALIRPFQYKNNVQLISQYGVDPQITSYIDTLNFYVVPVVNPDGYEYSRSDITPQVIFYNFVKRFEGIFCCTEMKAMQK